MVHSLNITRNGEVIEEETLKQMGYVSSNSEDRIGYAGQYLDLGFDELCIVSPADTVSLSRSIR